MTGMADTIRLACRVQSLPQELQDQIFDMTFATFLPHTVDITAACRPPSILQVNRRTREPLATQYYTRTTFQLGNSDEPCHPSVLAQWLGSLTCSHLHQLNAVHYFAQKPADLRRRPTRTDDAVLNEIAERLQARYISRVACGFLRICVRGVWYRVEVSLGGSWRWQVVTAEMRHAQRQSRRRVEALRMP